MSDEKNILDKTVDAAKDAYDSAAQGLKNLKEKIVGEPSTEDKVADKVSGKHFYKYSQNYLKCCEQQI